MERLYHLFEQFFGPACPYVSVAAPVLAVENGVDCPNDQTGLDIVLARYAPFILIQAPNARALDEPVPPQLWYRL